MKDFFGKMKAVTFSYDDAVVQDLPLIEMLNFYGLKGTFNMNSGLFGGRNSGHIDDVLVYRDHIYERDVKEIYLGHEVAAHTVNHPNLNDLSEDEIVREIEEDKKKLSEIVGYDVVGMAYPCGSVDDRVIETVRNRCSVKYARTVAATGSFTPSADLFRFECTTRSFGENYIALAQKFVELECDAPQLFAIWGHSYEFDWHKNWRDFDKFLKILSGRNDIFYGTNSEVLLGEKHYK